MTEICGSSVVTDILYILKIPENKRTIEQYDRLVNWLSGEIKELKSEGSDVEDVESLLLCLSKPKYIQTQKDYVLLTGLLQNKLNRYREKNGVC